MIRRLSMAALVLTCGCGGSIEGPMLGSGLAPGSDSFQDDDPPIGCQTGTDGCDSNEPGAADGASAGEPPGAPVGGPCDDTGQCVEGAVCAAAFQDGDAGPLLCRAQCIELDDPSAWCSDDSACCSGTCSSRGMCLESEGTGATASTSGGASDDTSGSTSEGTSEGTSGGTE